MWFYVMTFYLALPLLVLAASRWGGWPEKSVAILFVAAALATMLVRSGAATKYHSVELGVFAVDLALLAGLAAVAVRANRWWTIWAAAFQAITVTGHLAKMATPGLSRMAYALMLGVSAYPALIALALGIWNHHRATIRAAGAISSGSSPAVPRPRPGPPPLR